MRRCAGRTFRRSSRRSAPALSAALEKAVHGHERVTRGEAAITVSGRTFPIGFTTTTMSADGTPDNMSGTVIFQDISDNKRLEELRLRAERLEAVAELSASLAHEIKNPLASIRSAVEQLGSRARATEDERVLATLIVRESDRLSRLLSEFLDFARVRVTRGERVNMGEVAQAAVRLADTHPDRKSGVSVTCVDARPSRCSSRATRICSTARSSTSRSTPCRPRPPDRGASPSRCRGSTSSRSPRACRSR